MAKITMKPKSPKKANEKAGKALGFKDKKGAEGAMGGKKKVTEGTKDGRSMNGDYTRFTKTFD